MIYSFTLQTVGLVTGLLLLALHCLALWRSRESLKLLKQFPRSRMMGTVLIALAAIWGFLLIRGMDLGEFARLRNPMLLAIVVGALLAWKVRRRIPGSSCDWHAGAPRGGTAS